MEHIVDARGLACPQPVIDTRKALESFERVTTIVDNQTALENIRRLAQSLGCITTEETKNDGVYIHIEKSGGDSAPLSGDVPASVYSCPPTGPRVLLVSREVMGSGDDILGGILMRAFFHTLAETRPAPGVIIFFNSGVKLAVQGSTIAEDLRLLEQEGVKILSCGTCLDYFKIKDRLIAGSVSNMYDIKEMMLAASSTISL